MKFGTARCFRALGRQQCCTVPGSCRFCGSDIPQPVRQALVNTTQKVLRLAPSFVDSG